MIIALMVTILLVVVFIAANLRRMVRSLLAEQRADFAKCVAHMASVVSNRMVAQVLRAEADRYDAPSEQRVMRSLADHHYRPGGPSMPVIWLRHRADVIDPPPEVSTGPEWSGKYTLSGRKGI